MPDLAVLQRKVGYTFSNLDLLQRALTHRSVGGEHNERLEFLGDSLINVLIAERLYQAYPEAPEGELSAMRASLVCGKMLAEVARSLSLGEYMLLGEGTLKSGGRRLDSVLADTYEALLGGIYLDSSWENLREIVHSHFSGRLDGLDDMRRVRDAKSLLQEKLQAQKMPLPHYEVTNVGGPGHAQLFRVTCRVDMLTAEYTGEGSSRRKAEQSAAQQVLAAIEKEDE